MFDSEENQQNLEFYKKRLDLQTKQNLVLKDENTILRKELNNIKKMVTNIIAPQQKQPSKEKNSEDLRQILEFQHNRIESLENENLELKRKYERILFENEKKTKENEDEDEKEYKNEGKSKVLFAKYSENTEELHKANKTIRMLESKLKEMNSNYAKEIIDLKTKLTTQTATMIINKKEVNDFRVHSADGENKEFLFKRKDNLIPIDKNIMSAHKLQNKSMFDNNNLFNYSKTNK